MPGGEGIAPTDDLVALWKSAQGQRFQNYRAVFTVLDVPTVSRAWLEELYAGAPLSRHAPRAWRRWVQSERWMLDIAFRQDGSRVRKDNGYAAVWDNDYLLQVLATIFI